MKIADADSTEMDPKIIISKCEKLQINDGQKLYQPRFSRIYVSVSAHSDYWLVFFFDIYPNIIGIQIEQAARAPKAHINS